MNRRHLFRTSVVLTALGALRSLKPAAAASQPLRLVKHPGCECCEGHATYLRQNGYAVTVEVSPDLDAFRQTLGIPRPLFGCHTILAGDYVIEGHVPASAIAKLFAERPAIRGISVPGMPPGSPGMTGPKIGPLAVYEIADGNPAVFLTE